MDILLQRSYETLSNYLKECANRAKLTLGDFTTLNPSEGLYYGFWPDDFLFPLITCPELLSKDEMQNVINFVTESIIGLEHVPDRIETDGMPVLSPGWYDSPLSYRMPSHMPAAWIRLVDYFESAGIIIPKKKAWANLIKRSIDKISFSCGLVYMTPQNPYVGYAYHDNIAITGFDLMSSLVIHRALKRAARVFDGFVDEETKKDWLEKSDAIVKNLWRLYDKDLGGFVAGSKDCHQISVWANGLIYGLIKDENIKTNICDFYTKNQQKIFKFGFTRQIAEDSGWQRLLIDLEVGKYMNGGFWPTGTGYVLPALYEGNRELAEKLIIELIENLPKFNFTEWVDAAGNESHAKNFLMALAIPLLGLKSIMEDKPMIEYL